MKTTVELPDALLAEAKKIADRNRTTLRALIEQGLRDVLAQQKRAKAKPFSLRDASVAGKGLKPGLAEGDWDTLRSLLYEGRP